MAGRSTGGPSVVPPMATTPRRPGGRRGAGTRDPRALAGSVVSSARPPRPGPPILVDRAWEPDSRRSRRRSRSSGRADVGKPVEVPEHGVLRSRVAVVDDSLDVAVGAVTDSQRHLQCMAAHWASCRWSPNPRSDERALDQPRSASEFTRHADRSGPPPRSTTAADPLGWPPPRAAWPAPATPAGTCSALAWSASVGDSDPRNPERLSAKFEQ